MQKLIEAVLKMMPVWFGIGFLGPALAEIYMRTPVGGVLNLGLESGQIYMICMCLGGAYGIFAWRVGRWV